MTIAEMNKSQVDQMGRGHRNKVLVEIVRSSIPALIARAPRDKKINPEEIAKDAIAVARVAVRELMIERIL